MKELNNKKIITAEKLEKVCSKFVKYKQLSNINSIIKKFLSETMSIRRVKFHKFVCNINFVNNCKQNLYHHMFFSN